MIYVKSPIIRYFNIEDFKNTMLKTSMDQRGHYIIFYIKF